MRLRSATADLRRRPGIHTPDGGYGFRARSLRSRPGMTLRLNQPAAVGDAAEMVIGVAEGVFDHGQPLEVVADLGLLGHADAAMELDRLLTDELPRFADLHFRRRDRG